MSLNQEDRALRSNRRELLDRACLAVLRSLRGRKKISCKLCHPLPVLIRSIESCSMHRAILPVVLLVGISMDTFAATLAANPPLRAEQRPMLSLPSRQKDSEGDHHAW